MRRDETRGDDWDSVTRQRGSADRWCFAGGGRAVAGAGELGPVQSRASSTGRQETSWNGMREEGASFASLGSASLPALPVPVWATKRKRSQEHARLEEWTTKVSSAKR